MEHSKTSVFISEKCVFADKVCSAIIVTANGIVREIIPDYGENDKKTVYKSYSNAIFEEFDDTCVLMAGLVDSHVHVNEPGRTDWEGFSSATRAAAAGGITTIVDMPLNSIPPTTKLSSLKQKMNVARKNAFVDIAFWGGVVPGNKKELKSLVKNGVVGFKCFLIPSGVDEFPNVTFEEVDEALEELKDTGSVLAFHAECELDVETQLNGTSKADPGDYKTFLQSRPPIMEVRAIEKVAAACIKSGVRCHIVHVSAAESLPVIEKAKKEGAPLTAETCHHYLSLSSEIVPHGATEYKCCPPIRDRDNREKLWEALRGGSLDMIVSDHSPCTTNLKEGGDFLSAWGGISSVQFGLSLAWTGARERGLTLSQISSLLSAKPAALCGLEPEKGRIAVDSHADFVVWKPDDKITIRRADILHKNKLTPYEGKELFGRVHATFLRGQCIYRDGKVSDRILGKIVYPNVTVTSTGDVNGVPSLCSSWC